MNREDYWLNVAVWNESIGRKSLGGIALMLSQTSGEDYYRMLDDYHYFEGWGGEVAAMRFEKFGKAP